MEERIPSPSPGGEGKYDPSAPPNDVIATASNALVPSNSFVFHSGTYLVQLPKDQIYRVPPPENAVLAESLQDNSFKRRRSSGSFLKWFLIVVILLGIVLATCSIVFSVALKPKNPAFHVKHFLIKNSQLRSRHVEGIVEEYDVDLVTENPNVVWSVDYEEGGNASFSYGQQKIAKGKPTGLFHGSKGKTVVKLLLVNGSKRRLRDIGIEGKRGLLSVNLPGKMKFGMLPIWRLNMLISCNFALNNTPGNDEEIISQGCQVTF